MNAVTERAIQREVDDERDMLIATGQCFGIFSASRVARERMREAIAEAYQEAVGARR
jgi:hypothetical protein